MSLIPCITPFNHLHNQQSTFLKTQQSPSDDEHDGRRNTSSSSSTRRIALAVLCQIPIRPDLVAYNIIHSITATTSTHFCFCYRLAHWAIWEHIDNGKICVNHPCRPSLAQRMHSLRNLTCLLLLLPNLLPRSYHQQHRCTFIITPTTSTSPRPCDCLSLPIHTYTSSLEHPNCSHTPVFTVLYSWSHYKSTKISKVDITH